jgi:cobalt-zinc-cadmium efflux system protein
MTHHGAVSVVLRRCLLLTLGMGLVELAGGFVTGSLALLGDAAHMATDAFGLALAYAAARLTERSTGEAPTGAAPGGAPPLPGPRSRAPRRGARRFEAWAALGNAVLLLALVVGLVVEAVSRLSDPPALLGGATVAVAVLGLLVNLVVLRWLSHASPTLSVRAAIWHVFGDLLGSLTALASGVFALLEIWPAADPVLALGIAALLLSGVVGLARESWVALRKPYARTAC